MYGIVRAYLVNLLGRPSEESTTSWLNSVVHLVLVRTSVLAEQQDGAVGLRSLLAVAIGSDPHERVHLAIRSS